MIYKALSRSTRTPLKTRVEHMYSGIVLSFYTTCGTRCVILVTNLVVNHK